MKLEYSVGNSMPVALIRVTTEKMNELRQGLPMQGYPIFWAIDDAGYIVLWPQPSDEALSRSEI